MNARQPEPTDSLAFHADREAPAPPRRPEPGAGITSTPAPSPRAGIIVKAMPDGAVLFSTETELYFGLNPTGMFIWEQLHPACDTVEAICERLSETFPGGEPSQVRRDVDRLLAMLVEKQLADPRTPC